MTRHVGSRNEGEQYILRVSRCSHITSLGTKYILYSYMDPLVRRRAEGGEGGAVRILAIYVRFT